MKWIEVSVEADGEGAEAVAEAFQKLGHGGVAIEGAVQSAPLDGVEYPLPAPGRVTVRTYLPADSEFEDKRRSIVAVLGLLGTAWPFSAPVFREMDEQDWANAWKEHFHVLRIGRRVVVKPTWRDYTSQPDDAIVELDPGMAFGTGLHPSTRLCLLELDATPPRDTHVLDLGTGSGILAIAAARLGARDVLALDIDSVAVTVATDNVRRNGLSDRIAVARGTLPLANDPRRDAAPSGFDIAVANITAPVLTGMAEHLVAALRPGGRLIAGGILDDLAPALRERFESLGARVLKVAAESDWRVIVAQRNGK